MAASNEPWVVRAGVVAATVVLVAALVALSSRLVGTVVPLVAGDPAVPAAPTGVATAPSADGAASPDNGATPAAPADPSAAAGQTPADTSGGPGASGTGQAATASTLPPDWPVSLPDPGEYRLLGYNPAPEQRWVLSMPGTVQLVGGRLFGGLDKNGWETKVISTSSTATAVGWLGDERVSIAVRPNDGTVPDGWLFVEVIYQGQIPPFDLPPPPENPEDRARRGA